MVLKKIFYKILDKFIKERGKYIITETIVNNNEWKKLKEEIKKKNTWFVLTPADYDYCKCLFNLRMNKREFSDILKKRINFLKQNKENIQLSIHLGKVRKFLDLPSQENKFREAMKFMSNLGIKPTKLITIDGVYDENTVNLAKKYGIIELMKSDIFIIDPLLKIIQFLGIKLSFVREIYYFCKKGDFRSIFHLILGEIIEEKYKTIHVEALVRNDMWAALKKKIIRKEYIWFVITPANYDYCKIYFNLNMNKNEFSDILRKRIIFLKENNVEIQLHIHLGRYKKFLDNQTQEDKFQEAMDFISNLGIKPKKFVAGWWIYDKYTVNLVKKYGFKEISDYKINPFLRIMNINGLKIKYVHKYRHDFDFI